MPSLQDIRVRILSVKSTQKITQAMKMVAAAKLRRAQNAAENSRPYSSGMSKIIDNLNNGVIDKNMQPKLLVGHPEKGNITLVVVATSERGLCGGFNSSIIKKTKDFLTSLSNENRDFKIFCIGKKGVDALNRQYGNKIIEVVDMKNIKKLDFTIAQNIASKIINLFNKLQCISIGIKPKKINSNDNMPPYHLIFRKQKTLRKHSKLNPFQSFYPYM